MGQCLGSALSSESVFVCVSVCGFIHDKQVFTAKLYALFLSSDYTD